MEVGREIRRIREAKGWSQTKVAAGAEMSVSGLSQIETGARNPSAVTLAKLAEALEVEVADLFPKVQASLPFDGPEDQEEQRRLVGYVRPWLLLLDSYSERWERAAKEESFGIDAFMEFSAATGDILKSVNWVQEHLQCVQGIDPMAGPIGFVFRESLLRITNTMGLVSEAALSIFGRNMLAEARKRRAEINSAREELAKRIAT
jgi:transcriptional regulator with XRE-family HTH domain